MLGEPILASGLSPILYPANVLFLIFPISISTVIFYYIHFVISSVSSYLLARSFNFTSLISLTVAIFYTYSIKNILHVSAGHITMVAAFSLFPLSFLLFSSILKQATFRKVGLLALILALIYILYPTILYYSAIFLILYYCYFLINNLSKFSVVFKNTIIPLISVLFTFIGIISYKLIPQLEFANFSTRSNLTIQTVALPIWNLKNFILSLIFPYPNLDKFDHESLIYFGLAPIILSIIGFFKLNLQSKVLFSIVFIITLIFIAGTSTPLFEIFYEYFPFLKFNRVTTRLWFAVVLAISLLAAYGLKSIKSKKIIYIAIAFFLFESFFLGYMKIFEIPKLNFGNEKIYQYLSSDNDFFRVYCTSYCFNPQLIQKYNIQVLHGETPIQHASYVKFLQKAGNYNFDEFAVIFPPYQIWQVGIPPVPDTKILGDANVKYIASTYNLTDSNVQLLEQFDEILLYKNLSHRPRAYFRDSQETVNISNYSPNNIVLNFTNSLYQRSLIFSDLIYPGWNAYALNKKIIVNASDNDFRKITVPANTDRLELRFEPKSLVVGKAISIGTIIMLLLFFLRRKANG